MYAEVPVHGSIHTPDFVRSIASRIKTICPDGVYLIAGGQLHGTRIIMYPRDSSNRRCCFLIELVLANWRTPTDYQDLNQEFTNVCFDYFNAISPRTIGQYNGVLQADAFAEGTVKGDMKLIRDHNEGKWPNGKLDYIPVVFPGWSGHNTFDGKDRWYLDRVRRKGGEFLWRQMFNATKDGAKTIYVATWDG